MILGRPAQLWLGAGTAIYGLVAVFHILGFDPTADQTNYVAAAMGAIIALISGVDQLTAAAGRAARDRLSSNGTNTTGTGTP